MQDGSEILYLIAFVVECANHLVRGMRSQTHNKIKTRVWCLSMNIDFFSSSFALQPQMRQSFPTMCFSTLLYFELWYSKTLIWRYILNIYKFCSNSRANQRDLRAYGIFSIHPHNWSNKILCNIYDSNHYSTHERNSIFQAIFYPRV